jgi:hypothetical protein
MTNLFCNFGRHEHLYAKIQTNIIRSDAFKGAWSQIRGCQVILCTLSMLSNRFICNFTTSIPVKTLIVDEASQIEIGDYIPVFTRFQGTLRKVCFIGDDKQCKSFCYLSPLFPHSFSLSVPPYGQEDLEDLQSVFEITHLHKLVVFLDTQCMSFHILYFHHFNDKCL